MKMELASLMPLQVPKISLPKNRQGEGLATHTLYRKTSQLLETLYQMSANAKVVNMKQTKSGRSYTNVPWLKHLGSRGVTGSSESEGAWPTVCEQPPRLPSALGRDWHLLPVQPASRAGFAPRQSSGLMV